MQKKWSWFTVLMTSIPLGGPAGCGELLQLVRDGSARTKAELAELGSLGRSTVSARLDALLDAGLLVPVGGSASTGGRPATRFALARSGRCVVAVDLGASHAAVGVCDLTGAVVREVTVDCDIASGPEHVLDRVVDLALGLLSDAGLTADDVLGVGIGVPGPVEHSSGRPVHPPIMPGWHEYDVPARLGQAFRGPVLVDNDVNLLALGEHVSSWPDEDHLLYVKVSTGIGAGIIADRHLVRGAVGTAGDLGHVRVTEGGDTLCRCGNTGCLEAVAAGPAVAAGLGRDDLTTAADVVAAVGAGDVPAARAVREAGRAIGGVLATCVNLFNPSVVVLGGTLSGAGDHLVAGVREVVYQRSLPLATKELRIVTATGGDRVGLLGAAALVLDAVLAAPSVDALVAAASVDAAG